MDVQEAAQAAAPKRGLLGGDGARALRVVAIVLLCLGAAERMRQYAARTSFWADEAFVVLNIRALSPPRLMGKLLYDQAAPPVFLWSLKALSTLGGEGELTMRAVPLLCGLAALVVFGLLAWRALPPHAALLAIGLFALARRLVEYSAQVKQYSGDVLVSALIVLAAVGRPEAPPLRRLRAAAVVAATAVWFSHPAAIVFGGASLVLTLDCLRQGRREAVEAIAWNLLFAGSFGLLFVLSIHPQHTDYLYRFWRPSFPDWQHPWLFPHWLWTQGFEFLQSPDRWAAPLFALLILLSLAFLAREDRRRIWAVCAAPIVLTIVAACLRQYPFNGSRLTLFLMPQLFLLLSAGGAVLWELLPPGWRVAWWALPIALVGYGIGLGAGRFVHPHYESHIRPAVEFVKKRRRPGEGLVLIGGASGKNGRPFSGHHYEALCYWPHPPPPVHADIDSFDQAPENRFWVLVTFSPGDVHSLEPLLDLLRAQATEKSRFVAPQGGAAYLFERRGGSD